MGKDITKLIWQILRLLGILAFVVLSVYSVLHFIFKLF